MSAKGKKNTYHIGLVDADLLCNGTRHPNLALLKIAGYFRDNGYIRKTSGTDTEDVNTYELLTNESNSEELQKLDHIYVSCVFSFTLDDPPTLLTTLRNDKKLNKKVHDGGTGSYANLSVENGFAEKRDDDMHRLEKDTFLRTLTNKSGRKGIDMRTQMPDYHLYDEFVGMMETLKTSSNYYKDYKDYSIGFLTRGCFRRCPFCVNKLEHKALPYSKLNDFLDNERDEKTGKLVRPYIYLWDDNFLASPNWEPLLDELIATGRPFQFRQGLDERLLAQNKRGEDMAKKLASAHYHGDFIFAFDNWSDRPIIEKALKIWKKYNPNKGTKFYLFCGYKQSKRAFDAFYQDIWELFQRIRILMQYKCVGYVMRHEDYHQAPIENFYVQVARWCNQQAFYKKQSFWEFCYRNQSYWEETTKGITDRPKLIPFCEFEIMYQNGFYEREGLKVTKPVQTILDIFEMFPEHRDELIEMFNYKMVDLIDQSLWTTTELPNE